MVAIATDMSLNRKANNLSTKATSPATRLERNYYLQDPQGECKDGVSIGIQGTVNV